MSHSTKKKTKIVLASGSARRTYLMDKLKIGYKAISADIDETPYRKEIPSEYVMRMAREKAEKILDEQIQFKKPDENLIIIGGDVTIDLDDEAVGKATNGNEAFSILKSFNDRHHYIRGGLAIYHNEDLVHLSQETTHVHFKDSTDEEIQAYIDQHTDEWHDKAGAYAAQGEAARFIDHIEGSYYNLLGLPIFTVAEILVSFGIKIDYRTISILRKSENKELERLNK